MKINKFGFALLLSLAALLLPPAARAQYSAETAVHSFTASEGNYLQSPLVLGGDGNFYGTAANGGANGLGTIYLVTPGGVVTVLHSFASGENNGGYMQVTGFTKGSDGNFYGTIVNGGASHSGEIYQLTPDGGFTVLYESTSSPSYPGTGFLSILQAADGNFYGTYTGLSGEGSIYRFAPGSDVTDLSMENDLSAGVGLLTQGSDGNLYGVSVNDGAHASGAIVKITLGGTASVLYNFNSLDSGQPNSGGGNPGQIYEGLDGNFYGIATGGGLYGGGTFFRLTPDGTFTDLNDLRNADGGSLRFLLGRGSDGNFIGFTSTGGTDDEGTLFEITPTGVLTILQSFSLEGAGIPQNNLVQASDGSFYGASNGSAGLTNSGTLIRFVLSAHPPFFDGEVSLGNGAYYLHLPGGTAFGYYSYLSDPGYLDHYDLGYEYVFNADDDMSGVYLYDFKSSDFFYTSPTFPFPYLYDFDLDSVVYYYPDPNNPGHYNTNGVRYFYVFNTGQIISK